MKKIILIFLALVIFMCGCSTVNSSLPLNIDNISPTETNIKKSIITTEQIVSLLDSRLSTYNYPTLKTVAHSQINKKINDKSYRIDLYIPNNGMYLYFISNSKDESIYQITFKTNTDKLHYPSIDLKECIEETLLSTAEPSIYDSIISQLRSYEQGQSSAAGEQMECNYQMFKNYSQALDFHIKGEKVIDVDNIDFSEGTITEAEVDWTIPEFVNKLDLQNLDLDAQPVTLEKSSIQISIDNAKLESLPADLNNGVVYRIGPSVFFYLLASEKGRLERIELMLICENVDVKSMFNFGYIANGVINILDPEQAEQISNTINLNDIGTIDERSAAGGKMHYSYEIKNDCLMFVINRISSMPSMQSESKKR